VPGGRTLISARFSSEATRSSSGRPGELSGHPRRERSYAAAPRSARRSAGSRSPRDKEVGPVRTARARSASDGRRRGHRASPGFAPAPRRGDSGPFGSAGRGARCLRWEWLSRRTGSKRVGRYRSCSSASRGQSLSVPDSASQTPARSAGRARMQTGSRQAFHTNGCMRAGSPWVTGFAARRRSQPR
jgi:hypothetical protein